MSNQGSFLFGIVVGAGVMYLLDPDRGRRRRRRIRDRMVHRGHELEAMGGAAAGRVRDLGNRARGAMHEARARLHPEVVDDPILEARVRAELGRLTSNPGRVEVSADHGRGVLTGQVAEDELSAVAREIQRVRGVHELVNRLKTAAGPVRPSDSQESPR